MAQVTMTSQEYLELIEKARLLDKVLSSMVDNMNITVDENATWNSVTVEVKPHIPQHTLNDMVQYLADTVVANEQAMGVLFQENSHFFNPYDGLIHSHWDNEPGKDEVDLLKNKTFSKAWEEAKNRANEEEE